MSNILSWSWIFTSIILFKKNISFKKKSKNTNLAILSPKFLGERWKPCTWLQISVYLRGNQWRNYSYLVIRVFLPRLDLLDDVVTEILFDPEVKITKSVGFYQNTFPCCLGCTIFGSFLDLVVPILRPVLERLGIAFFNLCPFLDQRYQTVAEFLTILDPPRRPLVVARLPEGIWRRYQHVVVAVMWHLSLSRENLFTWKWKDNRRSERQR